MIFKKNLKGAEEWRRNTYKIMLEVHELTRQFPNGNMSDDFCKCQIIDIQIAKTFARIIIQIVPKSGCFENICFRPNLYTDKRYPVTFILAFDDNRLPHPNIDFETKRYAIPDNGHTLPNSLAYVIKYLKFISLDACLYHVPYNLKNMLMASLYRTRQSNDHYWHKIKQMSAEFNRRQDEDDLQYGWMTCNMNREQKGVQYGPQKMLQKEMFKLQIKDIQ